MTNQIQMANAQMTETDAFLRFSHSSFHHSDLIRHSSFVIRHLPATPAGGHV
jgi:hypothetical protein